MLNIKQAAAVLGISPKSLYGMVAKKRIPYYQYGGPGGTIRFSEDDLREYLDASRVDAARAGGEGPRPEPAAPEPNPPKASAFEHLGI